MALATRCPHCETVFKLDLHLLAPHDGRVRCGHCQEVFDAAHHRFELRDEHAQPGEIQHAAIVDDDLAIGPPPTPAQQAEPQKESAPPPAPVRPTVAAPRTLDVGASLAGRPPYVAPSGDSDRTIFAAATSPIETTPERMKQFVRVGPPAAQNDDAQAAPTQARAAAPAPTPARPVEPAPSSPSSPSSPFVAPVDDRTEPFIGPARGAPEPPPPPPAPAPAPSAAPAWREDEEPAFGTKAPGVTHPASANEAFPVTRESRPLSAARPRRSWRVAGGIVAVLLALLLIVQLAWWQREEVMVLVPGSHSVYVDICDEIGCTISPPRDIDGLQIESSGLRQVDGPHKLELKLSLRNRLNVALAYPALELTLLDDKNNVAIRRVLWPQDYARPGTIFAIGIPPQSAQPVVVRLDTGDAVAANYRVQVFYP